jgi:hypothetical protein
MIWGYACESNDTKFMEISGYDQSTRLQSESFRTDSEPMLNNQQMTIRDRSLSEFNDQMRPNTAYDQNTVYDQMIPIDMSRLQRCLSPCDCPSGQDCISEVCQTVTPPVYCCDRREECPTGATCRTATLMTQQCGECEHLCDCETGEVCELGQCVRSNTVTYCCERSPCPSGAMCEGRNGMNQCPSGCVTACDCWGGQGCVNGECSSDASLRYCCDRALCPQDASCEYDNGSSGVCPYQPCTTACDCPTAQSCQAGRCILSATEGLLYCCIDAECPVNANCQELTGELSVCMGKPECETACDCLQGFACQAGFCERGDELIVCCEGNDCLPGLRCQHENGQLDECSP